LKKIIGFDSWLGGAVLYQRLIPALEAYSIKLTLVHISSWGNDVDCPTESRVGDLLARDIRFYGNDNFERILDIEQPDAVILTSTDTFAHRAMIRYCKQRDIPTLNLYHGVRSVIDTEDDLGSPKIPFIAYVKNILSKIVKLFIHTFPVYAKSLWKTKASAKDWIRFISDVLYFSVGRDPAYKRSSDDSKTTKCAVYIDADIAHATGSYGLEKEDVVVVGNPDFNHFGMRQSLIGSWSPRKKIGNELIMYLETGFSSVGQYYSSTQEFIDHLIHTSKSLNAQGYQMLLKLKPNQLDGAKIVQGIAGSQIELVDNESFLSKLVECSACICERTSLAILPALMGIPLFLAKYGPLEPVAYGSVLKSYPKSHLLFDPSNVSEILINTTKNVDKQKLQNWLNINAGPRPFEKMPERVADIIEKMIVTVNRSN